MQPLHVTAKQAEIAALREEHKQAVAHYDECITRLQESERTYLANKEAALVASRDLNLATSSMLGGRRLTSGVITARESNVMTMLLEGKAHKEIGAALNISESRSKALAANVYRKYGVHSRIELQAQQNHEKEISNA